MATRKASPEASRAAKADGDVDLIGQAHSAPRRRRRGWRRQRRKPDDLDGEDVEEEVRWM